jgi:Fe2+ or Zn2+ uptake regulation protein
MATVPEKDNVFTLVFRNEVPLSKGNAFTELNREKAPLSDNAIRRWLKQFQETGSVLHRKEREDRELRRKLFLESRKLGHLACQERRAC